MRRRFFYEGHIVFILMHRHKCYGCTLQGDFVIVIQSNKRNPGKNKY